MELKSPAGAAPLTESEVVAAVMNHFAHDPNVVVFRRNVGAMPVHGASGDRFVRFGQPGMADIWGIIKKMHCVHCGALIGVGVHLEIECKRAGAKTTPAQEKFLKTVREMGGVAIVAQPVPEPANRKNEFGISGDPEPGLANIGSRPSAVASAGATAEPGADIGSRAFADPTGFRALKVQLAGVDKDICPECAGRQRVAGPVFGSQASAGVCIELNPPPAKPKKRFRKAKNDKVAKSWQS